MRILAIISGEYGARHVDNIRQHGPAGWQIEVWKAPAAFPLVIDYPEDYLPEQLPDLLEPVLADQADIVVGSRYLVDHRHRRHLAPSFDLGHIGPADTRTTCETLLAEPQLGSAEGH